MSLRIFNHEHVHQIKFGKIALLPMRSVTILLWDYRRTNVRSNIPWRQTTPDLMCNRVHLS